jgi:hypothetical protein
MFEGIKNLFGREKKVEESEVETPTNQAVEPEEEFLDGVIKIAFDGDQRQEFLLRLGRKIEEYKSRIAIEGKYKDSNAESLEAYLSASYKMMIALKLRLYDAVSYESIRKEILEGQPEGFNQDLFDNAWWVISKYAKGEEKDVSGGTGF